MINTKSQTDKTPQRQTYTSHKLINKILIWAIILRSLIPLLLYNCNLIRKQINWQVYNNFNESVISDTLTPFYFGDATQHPVLPSASARDAVSVCGCWHVSVSWSADCGS